MTRQQKIIPALVVTVLLHGLLLRFGLAPKVEGLPVKIGSTQTAPAPSAAAEPAEAEIADADDTPAVEQTPAALRSRPDNNQPLDVGWAEVDQPAAKPEKPAEPTPAKPEPVAAPVIAVKPAPKPESKPAPKVEPEVAAKPPASEAKAVAKVEARPASANRPAVPAKPAASTPDRRPAPASTGTGTRPVQTAGVDYGNRVRQHLARFAGALPAGAVGEAKVQFVVQPDGRVTDLKLVKASGHAGLDALAMSLPLNAQPLPLPGAVAQRLEVPIQAAAQN